MKNLKTTLFLILGLFVLSQPVFATVERTTVALFSQQNNNPTELQGITPEMAQMGLNQFLTLTPAKYKEMTGQKLGFKKTLQLKAAQKFLKAKSGRAEDFPKGLYIVLAILGWAWLLMGMMDDWKGNDWWVNLLLVFLCWIPGVIHALVKMKKYYS
jgi:uncharacterized membrane protein YqaE (UPF0057 family)